MRMSANFAALELGMSANWRVVEITVFFCPHGQKSTLQPYGVRWQLCANLSAEFTVKSILQYWCRASRCRNILHPRSGNFSLNQGAKR
jgi:hypothetical protein